MSCCVVREKENVRQLLQHLPRSYSPTHPPTNEVFLFAQHLPLFLHASHGASSLGIPDPASFCLLILVCIVFAPPHRTAPPAAICLIVETFACQYSFYWHSVDTDKFPSGNPREFSSPSATLDVVCGKLNNSFGGQAVKMGNSLSVGAEKTTWILINAFGYFQQLLPGFPQCDAPSAFVFLFHRFQIAPLAPVIRFA